VRTGIGSDAKALYLLPDFADRPSSVANHADYSKIELSNGQSVDYVIDLLTFAATDYSSANLNPTGEQFVLIVKLVEEGFISGTVTRDKQGGPQNVLCEEITSNGKKLLAELVNQKRKSRSPLKSLSLFLRSITPRPSRHPANGS